MGCATSRVDTEAQQISNQIESQIRKDKLLLRNEIKMLLLGAGESGKSTILKQMKLIHEGSYTETERESYKEIIFHNTLQSMCVIIEAMGAMRIAFEKQESPRHAETIEVYSTNYPTTSSRERAHRSLPRMADALHPSVVAAIAALWRDAGVQKCFRRSREYQLNDSAGYYFDAIERIGQPSYIPTDQDVLRSRVKTTGITETVFVIGDLKYRMFDVGGQRSERKKWIHCFENVTAIVFLVAVSEYDQTLYEDDSVNRMQEALNLFDSICNSRWFTKTSMILFLNKIDLLRQKLEHSPVERFFCDFEMIKQNVMRRSPNGQIDREQLLQAAADFFSQKFVSLNQSPSKQVYVHLTCATDTSQIRFVLSAVNDIIIQVNLRECGLL